MHIALSNITPSPTNPRRHFDEKALAELADSVRRHGVIQPIVLRPNGGPDTYEIVAGERRYRAAKAAGLTEIPATVAALSDAEVLEIQVVENLQREGLAPLEEAEGYAALMKCSHDDGRPYTAEEIATKVGKSKGYVYARLKLGELCEAGKKALAAGEISVSVAELIARIPGESRQIEAVEECADHYGAPMSVSDARSYIHRNFMLRLGEAPFDVKAVYKIEAKSGNPYEATALPKCGDCPKRTGNQPELFADVKAKDTCTDPGCFEEKTKAAIAIKVEEYRAAGREVITGAAAKKIIPKYEYQAPKGYVKLDARCEADEKGRNWRAVLGKAMPTPVLVENIHKPGEFIEMVPAKEAKAALLEKHPEIAKREKARAAVDRKSDLENEIFNETKWRVYLALRERIGREGITNAELHEIILAQLDNDEPEERVARLWGLEDGSDFGLVEQTVSEASGTALLQMAFDVMLPLDRSYYRFSRDGDTGPFERLAKVHGIDRKAIERQVKADLKAREKAKPVIVNSVGEPIEEGAEG